jgi:RNA polymerase primary sigma factor
LEFEISMNGNGGAGGSGFRMYMKELGHVRPLSREEEARLSAAVAAAREARVRLQSGDVAESVLAAVGQARKAEERLVEAHLPLVVGMAQRVLTRNEGVGLYLEDLVLAGNEGLVEGLRRYDPSRGYRVNTYVRWWVTKKISEEVRLYRWKIRIPDHAHRKLLRIMRVYRRLCQELGRDPTEEEVAGQLHIGVETLQPFLACWGAEDMVSLDRPVGEDGASTFGDLLPDTQEPLYAMADSALTERADFESLRDAVAGALASLSQRQRFVILMRYGLEDDQPRTFEQVGRKLGVTGERARQIEAKALRRLRHPSRAKLLAGFRR